MPHLPANLKIQSRYNFGSALASILEESILIFTLTRNRRPPSCCLSGGKTNDLLRGIVRQHEDARRYSTKWTQALHSFRMKLLHHPLCCLCL